MEIFGAGNLITLGIAIILIIFFRLLDRSNRSLEKVKKYVDRYKDDLAVYVEDKASIVQDYSISLDVEKKAADVLIHRIQTITREELSKKVEALSQLDERIQGYDESLNELIRMTGRVQENLNRIRDESAFVEGVSRRINDLREKTEVAEGEIGSVGARLETLESRLETENSAALERTAETVVADTRKAIVDLESRLAREEKRIEELFAQAVAKAGGRADKVEEAALAKLTGQADERLALIKTSFEDKLKSLQEFVKASRDGIQGQIATDGDEWKSRLAEMEANKEAYAIEARRFNDEWSDCARELSSLIKQQAEETRASIRGQDDELRWEIESRSGDWKSRLDELDVLAKRRYEEAAVAVREQDELLRRELDEKRDEWKAIYRDAGLEVADAVNERLDGYSAAHEERFSRISGIADDSSKLEEELRLAMRDAEKRVSDDFDRVTGEMRAAWETESGELGSGLKSLREELAGVEKGLADIKATAHENMSGELKTFEDAFSADLAKRKAEIGTRLEAWNVELASRMESVGGEAESKLKLTEGRLSDEMKREFSGLSDKLTADLESLKSRTESFEERASKEIREADETRRLLGEQLKDNLAEARQVMEEIRKESTSMSKAFERTGSLKKELDTNDEKVKGNSERLSRLERDVAKFETQFSQMKHLEDDINARIARFMAEKRRIEVMEENFSNLMRTSQSVEEKLAKVSNSDDMLQTVQIRIRQLDDVMKDTEDRFQRLEKKNETLQETNDSIERNFKTLQESEALIGSLEGTMSLLRGDVETVRTSVEALSAENEKTHEAAEKLATLDESLKWLEDRIDEMNKARDMVTRLASELHELDDNARAQLKITRSLLKQSSPKVGGPASSDEGAAPPRDRDNIRRLRQQGWSIDEIARTVGISKGQVELILELAPKDM